MLRQRVLTGLLLVAAAACAVYFLPTPVFAVVAGLVVLVGAWEWARLTALPRALSAISIVALAAALLGAWVLLAQGQGAALLWLAVGWWTLVLIMLALHEPGEGPQRLWRALLQLGALPTLVPAWAALLLLHGEGWWLLAYLVVLTALADTAAYFAGKRFGRHKLAPHISPGKTREGLLGALAAGLLWGGVGVWALELPLGLWVYFIGLALVVVLLSVTGDLLESLLKREAGAKDSGRILPGHGGVLDRIDSLTAAAPAFAFGLLWLN
jgi:phosphatidate cytidylyltransferase